MLLVNRLNEMVLLSIKNIYAKNIYNFTLKMFVYLQGTKIFQYCTCPVRRMTYNFHLSCKHMHLSFKSVCNKENKGVICNKTSLSYSSQSTRPVGRVL